jgi:hypothetical protein
VSNKFRVSLRIATVFSLVAVVLFFLSACSTSNDSATTPNNTVDKGQYFQEEAPSPRLAPQTQSNEDIYYLYISSEFPAINRSTALQLGNAICLAIGEGTGLYEIGQIGVNEGFTPEQAGKLVGASIGALCPEYKYLVDQLQ